MDKKELLTIIQNDLPKIFCSIIETSFDGIYITDSHANTVLVNKSYEKITGLKREMLLGRNMNDLLNEGVISISGTLLCLKYKKVITLEQKFKTNKKALITSQPMFDQNGNIILVVTNVRDMTSITNLRESLIENELKNQSFQEVLNNFTSNKSFDSNFICVDKKSLELLKLINRLKNTDAPITLIGETGVGKEIWAEYIFRNSNRKNKPFLKLNCGELNPNLVESELFGYEKGTFTGGNKNGKMGLFEMASTGTLFLDEISELELNIQVKLLRVLQEQEIRRLGGTKTIPIDVRIITASNKKLKNLVAEGKFRKDLYYRLETFKLTIHPLRERPNDIIPLAKNFLKKLNEKYYTKKTIDDSELKKLMNYSFPGNVRELKNIIYRAYIISDNKLEFHEWNIENKIAHKNYPITLTEDEFLDLNLKLKKIEWEYMSEALKKYPTIRTAAEKLSMNFSTFFRKKKKYEKLFK